ncbi:hypothetical protein B0A48_10718 [Cryoendolithus antarcticus]|uniref:Uncharacterized protein n=1 Tax=Cryoendolithus antarcticus TaxID=1507870 RepID=A0A1V8SYG1_9PEZI|nr:hypothetical protein B0A48_10718 [Cryoendolithus antarcticus]
MSWHSAEQGSRSEQQRSRNKVDDASLRETSYQDAVASNLAEFMRGSSISTVTGVALGAGGMAGPVAIGGGAANSTAAGGSQQEGGREASAQEEMQWRDAIRRHGEDLRMSESTVVVEVDQSEEVTGTVEVIQNKNYAHSLTVLYHNILRHMRVDTEFAGVRECLFVPFAMKPFTMEGAYRWREAIRRVLKERRFANTMRYLKDVLTGFRFSQVPPGRHADHPIRSLHGSVYVVLGIARPGDTDKGEFDPAAWAALAPFLALPGMQIFQDIKSSAEAIFQRRVAPSDAARWVNKLTITAKGDTPLAADFTPASAYRFNETVRVDFQVSDPGALTRADLVSLKVAAAPKGDLTVGSIANLKSVTFTYQTDFDTNVVKLSQGLGDLIDPVTGRTAPESATVQAPLTARELQNLRANLVYDVVELLQHLNENIEFYHKMIWWNMDRDRLWILLDGFWVPTLDTSGQSGAGRVSICSVVERNPLGIAGNSLIFKVSAGCHLGSTIGQTVFDNADKLKSWYDPGAAKSTPMYVSLPTDGLYAQTIMDDCVALEEHYGNIDWALNDHDLELGALDPSLLQSRRSDISTSLQPQKMPDTLISLQNATSPPAPQGFTELLKAVQNKDASRDAAGLAATQTLAGQGLEAATGLATAGQAAALKLAELATQQAAVDNLDKKIAAAAKADRLGLATKTDTKQAVIDGINATNPATAPSEPQGQVVSPKVVKERIDVIQGEVAKKTIEPDEGKRRIRKALDGLPGARKKTHWKDIKIKMIALGKPIQGFWTWKLLHIYTGPDSKPVSERIAGDSEQNQTGVFHATYLPRTEDIDDEFELSLEGYMMQTAFEQSLTESEVIARGIKSEKVYNFHIPSVPRSPIRAVVTLTAKYDEHKFEVESGESVEKTLEKKFGVDAQLGGVLKGLLTVKTAAGFEWTSKDVSTMTEKQTWTAQYLNGTWEDEAKVT